MRAVLRYRNFTLLWLAWMISMLGDWVLLTALPFYVYTRTGSALATGTMFIVETLPALLIGPVAGVLVDRWDRRRILVAGAVLQGGLVLLLLWLATGDGWLGLVYVVAFLQKAIAQFTTPAGGALLPRVVPPAALVDANASIALGSSLVGLVGPAAGGAALAMFGLPAVVLLDSVSFFAAAAFIACLALPPLPHGDRPASSTELATRWVGVWQEWRAGLRLIRHERHLTPLFAAKAVAGFAQGIITVLLVVFVSAVLAQDAVAFGWLFSAQGLGGLVGGVLVARVADRFGPARLLAGGLSAAGVLFLAAISSGRVEVVLALFVLIGMAIVGWTVSEWAILQRAVADQYRGRVVSAYTTTYAVLTLAGMGIASSLAGALGVVPLLTVAGVGYLLAGVVVLLRLDPWVAWDAGRERHVTAVEALLVEHLLPYVTGRRPLGELPDLAPEMDTVLETMALDGVEDEQELAAYIRSLLRSATATDEPPAEYLV